MTTPAYNCLFAFPTYSDVGKIYTPSLSSGFWLPSLPLTNLQSRDLSLLARSLSAANPDTRLRTDLGTDRPVRCIALPNAYQGDGITSPVSSVGKIRALGVPSSLLFNYDAGDDVVALGGTFTRTPTTDARAATYVDSNGVVRYAGENRLVRSAEFDNASWTKSNVTIAANSIAAPDGTTTADTLTASAGNGTVLQALGTLASAAFVFSIFLKRKTGSGNIQLSIDNGSTYTTVAVTTDWTRFQITQTLANPIAVIRIATNADAVYAWGAQAELGTVATPYVPTTSAINGAPRDGHFENAARSILIEDTRTNLVIQSDALATGWSLGVAGTPTNNVGTYAGRPFSRFAYNPANDFIFRAVTLTGDAVKAYSLLVKFDGVAGTSLHGFFDQTAATYRGIIQCTWAANGTMTALATIGTLLEVKALADGVYRILAQSTACTAAHTHWAIAVVNSGTVTSILVSGVQVENGPFPSSLIPTTTATVARNRDLLSLPESFLPQALTMYAKFVERGSILLGDNPGIVAIGNAAGTQYATLYAGGRYTMQQGAVGNVAEAAAAAPSPGDTVELRGTLASTGAVAIGQSLNGGAEAVSATSATRALGASFDGSVITIGGDNGLVSVGFAAIQSIRIAAGVQTLAYMQAIVYDSGWLNQYPAGLTAETTDGMNLPHVLIVPATQTAFRYCSIQIDDTTNANGYVDLGRLMILGGWQPSINMAYGAQLGIETNTTIATTDGGARLFNRKPSSRTEKFTIENLSIDEALASGFDLQRIVGTDRQLFVVFDPTDTTHLFRRAFPCTLRNLSPIDYPFFNVSTVPLEAVEDL